MVGETAALLAASRIVGSLNLVRCWFESDCLVLVREVLSLEPRVGWQMEHWMLDIRLFFSDHVEHSLAWIPRRHNRCALRLAKWAASSGSFGFLSASSFPSCILVSELLGS